MSDASDPRAFARALESLQTKLAYRFEDPGLLREALTHRSFSNESKSDNHNERLEFLGDAVLDDHISSMLFDAYPEATEGVLTRHRAALVQEQALYAVACELGLGPLLRLGKGELQTGGQKKPRLLAGALEALLGAVRRDGGTSASGEVVRKLFAGPMSTLGELSTDHKSKLQERVQRLGLTPPIYRLLHSEGPEHDKRFFIEVVVAGQGVAHGEGRSKAVASQRAAQVAMELCDDALCESAGEEGCEAAGGEDR